MDPKTNEKEHDGKRGCGAKRFSGAHPFRRALHVWLVCGFRFAFAIAVARAVFEKYDAGRVLVCRRAAPALVSRQAHALVSLSKMNPR